MRDVEEVEDAVVAHHGQPMVLFIKCDRLEPLVNLDLSQAQVAIEVVAHGFEEREPSEEKSNRVRHCFRIIIHLLWLLVLTLCVPLNISLREAVLP